MNRLFGTDGIRARAGEFPLNAGAIVAIGQAIGAKLGGDILVGQDTRLSSPWIFELLEQGIHQTSAHIEDAGVIPTPAIALLTKTGRFSGGVMISASHNPFDDNGIKVFSADGRKLKDEDEIAVEKRIAELLSGAPRESVDTVPDQTVTADNRTRWPETYEQLLMSHFPQGRWLAGMSVVAYCAKGAMWFVATALHL